MAYETELSPEAADASVAAITAIIDGGSGNGLVHGYALGVSCVATFADDLFTEVAHGLVDDDRIKIMGVVNPTGVPKTTIFFVRDAAADTFKIALTSGGTAINLSDNGTTLKFLLRLVVLTLNKPAFLAPSDGVSAFDDDPDVEDNPEHDGTLKTTDLTDSDNNLAYRGNADTSGAAINWNSLAMDTDVEAKITGGNITQPMGTLP